MDAWTSDSFDTRLFSTFGRRVLDSCAGCSTSSATVVSLIQPAQTDTEGEFLRQNPAPLTGKVANFRDVADVLAGPDAKQEYSL